MDHNNSDPACKPLGNIALTQNTVRRNISFHFLCETARTQTPILNAGAITLVWCTAPRRNFP